ncbi:glycosyltransferase family 2 protein [Pseudoalteromonas sp. MMG012]|uniref:glycosyltransferase family 2 protein n=1 Tax=Pseudoalteromonas sp. MMG012 TaxID=2822686 RepID=UPI001B39DA78|nr:glycosyltransferase family 2 protein [Pseudoalteromonas sp. MMG012]MBQ4849218.1 glycosyltransferase family 2 protein [Pseudoalteromonas sp. MMG012]
MDISVVIPLFNKAAFIERAIHSVLNQTVSVKEIIVVDDGSSDGGAELVKSLTSSKVILHSQSNQGVSCARNVGVSLCTSQYIAFLDADDYWYDCFVEEIMSLQHEYPSAKLFFTGYEFGFEDTKELARNSFILRNKGLLGDYFQACCHEDLPITASSLCLDKEALLSVGGFPESLSLGEDQVVWGAMACFWPIAYSARTCVVYDLSASNTTVKQPELIVPSPHIYAFDKLLEQGFVPHEMKRSLSYLKHLTVMSCVKSNLMQGHKIQAFKLLYKHPMLWWDKYRMFAYLLLLLPKSINVLILKSTITRKFRRDKY